MTSPTVVSGQRPRLTVTFFITSLFFRWCYINKYNKYCKCCLIATAMKFYRNNFIEYIYKEIKNYCWLLLITGLNLKLKSFTTYHVTLYIPQSSAELLFPTKQPQNYTVKYIITHALGICWRHICL